MTDDVLSFFLNSALIGALDTPLLPLILVINTCGQGTHPLPVHEACCRWSPGTVLLVFPSLSISLGRAGGSLWPGNVTSLAHIMLIPSPEMRHVLTLPLPLQTSW